MAKAIVDPAELRRFAQMLKRFNATLQDEMGALRGQMHALGNTWRDQEHHKFIEAFEQQVDILNRSIKSTDEHVPFLMRKAERIEQYLQQK